LVDEKLEVDTHAPICADDHIGAYAANHRHVPARKGDDGIAGIVIERNADLLMSAFDDAAQVRRQFLGHAGRTESAANRIECESPSWCSAVKSLRHVTGQFSKIKKACRIKKAWRSSAHRSARSFVDPVYVFFTRTGARQKASAEWQCGRRAQCRSSHFS